MSFIRIRKSHSGAAYPRKKKAVHRKPVWDDTIHDLTQLKATSEEIEDRKARHRSKNAVGVRLEKQNRGRSKDLSIASHDARQLAIMKEVLYNQQQFQNVLAKSDKMMSVVKDLFGDDPKRYTGIPNITTAPGEEDTERSGDIVAPLPDIQTRIEALSESVMDGSALNDIESNSDSEEESPDPIVYEPKFNMARFQNFLHAEERNQSMSTISGQAQLSQLDQGPVQSTQIHDTCATQENTFETPKKDANESISILRTPRSAINDTKKVKKSKKRVVQQQTEPPKQPNLNLTDLRKVLEHLEDEIADYERQTGRRAPAERQRQETFSGYTLSLVDSVTKLTRYLKESEMRLRAEMTVREQLTQDVFQLRALIDALTSDIILTQEEYGSLKIDYSKYKENTQDELLKIKSILLTADLYQPSEQTNGDIAVSNRPVPDIPPTQTVTEDLNTSGISALPGYIKEPSGAVLLSPPVRKTRIQREEESTKPVQQNIPMRQTSLIDLSSLPENGLPADQQMNGTYIPHSQAPTSGMPQFYSSEQSGFVPVSTNKGQMFSQNQGQGQIRPTVISHQNPAQVQQWNHPVTHQPNQIPSTRQQVPPAAKVSVPRPSPLVQSNVGISISGNLASQGQPQGLNSLPNMQQQSQGQGHLQGGLPLPNMPQQSNKELLASQIAELNKQHEEAQKRLEMLLKQQYHSDTEDKVEDERGHNVNNNMHQSPPNQQQGLPAYPVSPPISPISQQSDPYLGLQGLQNSNFPAVTRGITVSLPRAELELSAGSSPSPRGHP